jgi:hypothetical protein
VRIAILAVFVFPALAGCDANAFRAALQEPAPDWQRHALPNGLCSAEFPWEPVRTIPENQSALFSGMFTSAAFALGTRPLPAEERGETDKATLEAIRKMLLEPDNQELPAVAERGIVLDGVPGYEWVSQSKPGEEPPEVRRFVFLVRNGTQYHLLANYKPTPENEARAKRFFESFRFEPISR